MNAKLKFMDRYLNFVIAICSKSSVYRHEDHTYYILVENFPAASTSNPKRSIGLIEVQWQPKKILYRS